MTIIRLSEIPQSEPVPGYRVRFVHSENMTLAYWDIDAGATMPEHSHPHEQVASVIEGTFEMFIGGKREILEPGIVVVIRPHEPHSGRALTTCRIVDAFYPVRDDFR